MREMLFLILVVLGTELNAQNYLISFAGEGASTTVSTVSVENLRSGSSLVLNGSDVLSLSQTTGLNTYRILQSPTMKIFPNPSSGSAIVELSPPAAEHVQITVNDISGKVLSQIGLTLINTRENIRISGFKSGFYFINIIGKTYKASGKLYSTGTSSGEISIDHILTTQTQTEEKDLKTNKKGIHEIVEMQYTAGDILKFTGISGNYTAVKMDVPTQDKSILFNFIGCTDGDNNNYPVVNIGTQTWMAANLKTTKYSDGTNIPYVNTTNGWDILVETDKAFCYLQDNPSNGNIYGALYTWTGAMNGAASSNFSPSGVQGVCPTGWHIPGMDEWTTLINYLGGSNLAGGKMKETGTSHWNPNSGATNETGFTAIPGGFREDWGWQGTNIVGAWWSSTENNLNNSWSRGLDALNTGVTNLSGNKKYGFSVRCLKD